MTENHAELRLYFAYISDSSRGEGRFEREPSSEGSQRAVAQATKLIEQYLQPGWRAWGLHVGQSRITEDDFVAADEEEALSLIAHAEASFTNASGAIVPLDRVHGSTRFHRIIRFAEATRDQAEEIISVMKQSGHLPYSRDKFRQDFGIKEKDFIQRNDNQWKAALKFY